MKEAHTEFELKNGADAKRVSAGITHGSLCSGGIDGMAEGARRCGIETIWNCEIEPFQRALLKQEYPQAKQYKDVRTDTPTEQPTIISITSECQDISVSNNTADGILGTRSIILFHCIRICGVLQPDFILLENSAQIINRGWEFILFEFSKIGYDVQWQCLPLTAFNVQQQRSRLYAIAYSRKIALEGFIQDSIFREQIIQEQFSGVSPGWAQRQHIPEPGTLRTNNGFKNYPDRINTIGNMVHPRAAQ